jgi:hypothetical protein
MNYGHPLQFGTFITPVASPPERAVDLAVRCEALGYDLVTFQDHPYQPTFLDTWTLMTWVAARTSRIRIAANVHNLPLRPPAVLARSAASLDLLSGGRVELGLGSGAFRDAIEAMGGPRLEPGEAVDALEEAIGVIRGLWDAAERAPLTLAGEHYQLARAKRGPAPAHDIPILIGAYKPRMLRLTGRLADGWLPSLPYLQPGDLQRGNATIDEAAIAAGRDPREIRRMLNIGGRFAPARGGFLDGPPEAWVEDLLPLVVEDGIGTFLLMADDADTMERFIGEVAPALREAAGLALPGGFSAGPARRSAALAKRRPGIDYDAIPAALAPRAIEPGDPGYAGVRSTYMRAGSPGLVLPVRDTGEVAEALAFARRHRDVPLSVRSGGHGISGRSTNDGGIVIDLGPMNVIEVIDPARRRVRLGPAARWKDVAAALTPHGLAISSGDYGGVGVGGLATAGGIGWLARAHGLTIDHLRAVEMVLADGSVVHASEQEHPDLFWAVRGAGGNFGIVTSFEFEASAVGEVGFGMLLFDAADIAGFLERWGAEVEAAPRELTSFLLMGPPRRGRPVVAQVMAMVDSSLPENVIDALQPLANAAPLLDHSISLTTYAQAMANAGDDPHDGRGEPVARTGLVRYISPEVAAACERLLRSGETYFFQIRSVGGAVADVPPDATAYAHRDAAFSLAAFGFDRGRLDAIWDRDLYPLCEGIYLNFETDPRPERLHDAFPPATLARLREIKGRYDPENLFRDNFNIVPAVVSRRG